MKHFNFKVIFETESLIMISLWLLINLNAILSNPINQQPTVSQNHLCLNNNHTQTNFDLSLLQGEWFDIARTKYLYRENTWNNGFVNFHKLENTSQFEYQFIYSGMDTKNSCRTAEPVYLNRQSLNTSFFYLNELANDSIVVALCFDGENCIQNSNQFELFVWSRKRSNLTKRDEILMHLNDYCIENQNDLIFSDFDSNICNFNNKSNSSNDLSNSSDDLIADIKINNDLIQFIKQSIPDNTTKINKNTINETTYQIQQEDLLNVELVIENKNDSLKEAILNDLNKKNTNNDLFQFNNTANSSIVYLFNETTRSNIISTNVLTQNNSTEKENHESTIDSIQSLSPVNTTMHSNLTVVINSSDPSIQMVNNRMVQPVSVETKTTQSSELYNDDKTTLKNDLLIVDVEESQESSVFKGKEHLSHLETLIDDDSSGDGEIFFPFTSPISPIYIDNIGLALKKQQNNSITSTSTSQTITSNEYDSTTVAAESKENLESDESTHRNILATLESVSTSDLNSFTGPYTTDAIQKIENDNEYFQTDNMITTQLANTQETKTDSVVNDQEEVEAAPDNSFELGVSVVDTEETLVQDLVDQKEKNLNEDSNENKNESIESNDDEELDSGGADVEEIQHNELDESNEDVSEETTLINEATTTTVLSTTSTTTPYLCVEIECPIAKCSFGRKLDKNGCELCECLIDPNSNSTESCSTPYCHPCFYGSYTDENGCESCACKPRPKPKSIYECPRLDCASCNYGSIKDDYGCETCICIRPNSLERAYSCPPEPSCPFGSCKYGSVLNEYGCATCDCLKSTEPDRDECVRQRCSPCSYGYFTDADGCDTCLCKPDWMAPCALSELNCDLTKCHYGSYLDRNGCPSCECLPNPEFKVSCSEMSEINNFTQCNDDGTFKYKQCNDQECRCVTKDGIPISDFKTKLDVADQMNCECAIALYEVSVYNTIGFKLYCLSNGNYETIQCVGGSCACVNEHGDPLGPSVPIYQKHLLRCEGVFQRVYFDQYLTTRSPLTLTPPLCVYHREKAVEMSALDAHLAIPVCDDTGLYKTMQCDRQNKYCWCVNIHSGVELYGTRTSKTSPNCSLNG